MRNRSLYDAYIEGVVNAANYDSPGCGMETGGGERAHERHVATEQGFYDGKSRRVMQRHEFSREKVLRRAEVREAILVKAREEAK